MPQGLRVFNADGSLQFDSSSRLLRGVIRLTTNGQNGSTVIAGLSNAGSTIVVQNIMDTFGEVPAVSISGDTLSWTYQGTTLKQQLELIVLVY